MKKTWQTPDLEILDVSMTLAGTVGTKFDAGYEAGKDVPFENGQPAIFS